MSYPIHFHIRGEDGSFLELPLMVERASALGEESGLVSESLEESIDHYRKPITRQSTDPLTRFYKLKKEWEAATAYLSSIEDIVMHPAYQQIIGMGHTAIPFIIREMKEEPNHWFWALKAITGADPVPPEKRGRIKAMTEEWLFWLRQYEHS